MNVSSTLQQWYAIQARDLPWRRTGSPYLIWLSEIILQQTRVNQGIEYYLRFVSQYPRIEDMANASLDDILKLWQGLGYYTRARNMHETAKFIVNDLNGVFPDSFEQLLKLKGIGKYTAAAIASISYKEPVAVIDGNVFRVLARFFGIHEPVNSARGKLIFGEKAAGILDRSFPDIHNQAMMELGALVCLPRNPLCGECPLEKECVARARGIIGLLPLKSDKKQQRVRYFNYIFLQNAGYTWLSKRTGKDIWHSLYEFPLIETDGPVTLEELSAQPGWIELFGSAEITINGSVQKYKHQLTHQTLHCTFYTVNLEEPPKVYRQTLTKTEISNVGLYPVPRLIENYLSDLKHRGRL
jgi:A/G-specific adenine glycosylase